MPQRRLARPPTALHERPFVDSTPSNANTSNTTTAQVDDTPSTDVRSSSNHNNGQTVPNADDDWNYVNNEDVRDKDASSVDSTNSGNLNAGVNPFSVGQLVKVGTRIKFVGMVTNAYHDGTYDIDYQDGEHDYDIPQAMISSYDPQRERSSSIVSFGSIGKEDDDDADESQRLGMCFVMCLLFFLL